MEAVALITQINLEQNRLDLAVKEVANARKWAQDSLLVNLAESWVGLRVGGEKYQQAFYVFEELAQAESTTSTHSMVSQAVAEIHLGRLEEAEAALQQALAKDPESAEAIANSIVLNVVAGRDASELVRYVLRWKVRKALHGHANFIQYAGEYRTATCLPHRSAREERTLRQSSSKILSKSLSIIPVNKSAGVLGGQVFGRIHVVRYSKNGRF